jgi:hypothetical protein
MQVFAGNGIVVDKSRLHSNPSGRSIYHLRRLDFKPRGQIGHSTTIPEIATYQILLNRGDP